jgi:hypothetical protein
MKSRLRNIFFTAICALSVVRTTAASESKNEGEVASFELRGVKFLHRSMKDDQEEFTPQGQEDLDRWADKVTINRYRDVKDGEGLAATANAVLGTYKANRAMVLRTDLPPRTNERPAEYLIVVVFLRPEFAEKVSARFKIVGGVGTSIVYSHREYGIRSADQIGAWMKATGPLMEIALNGWEGIPVTPAAKK